MSFSEAYSKYTFDLTVSNATAGDEASLVVSHCMTDAVAFELRTAILGLSWPSGTTVDVQVTKQDFADTLYTTNLTTTPPSFT